MRYLGYALMGLLILFGIILISLSIAVVFYSEGWWGIGGLIFIAICMATAAHWFVERY
jgi:hypothetical protein